MMKLESDKHVVREGSCKECVRCLRLYLCDAEDCGGMSVWRTWFDSRLALSYLSKLTFSAKCKINYVSLSLSSLIFE